MNSCLSKYFISLAEDRKCVGIWWDTISLNKEPGIKLNAFSMIQSDHANAACILVHNKYLLDFEWRKDGNPVGDLEGGKTRDNFLTVNQNGTIEGDWWYRALTRKDCDSGLKPCGRDPKADVIDAGLRSWRNGILLRENWNEKGEVVLVATVGKEPVPGSRNEVIDCHYLGPVDEKDDPRPAGGSMDPRFRFGHIRLGNERVRPAIDARKLLRLPPASQM